MLHLARSGVFARIGRFVLLLSWWMMAEVLQGQEVQIEEVPDGQLTRYGAQVNADGSVQFSVFSPDANQVNLLLYDDPGSEGAQTDRPDEKERK
jgi:hypothetical protein